MSPRLRRGRPAAVPAAIAAIALLLAMRLPTEAADAPASRTLILPIGAGPADAVEVLRCHFDEGRIAVRFRGEIEVLREGEHLAAAGLRVAEITPTSATVEMRNTSSPAGVKLTRITRTEDGTLATRELATDPASLTAGTPASGELGVASMSSVAAAPAEGRGSDDAGNR